MGVPKAQQARDRNCADAGLIRCSWDFALKTIAACDKVQCRPESQKTVRMGG